MDASALAGLSSYDDAVPHPGADPRLAAQFAHVRRRRAAVDIDAVRDVVLVVSSSRGGSSMIAEILRRHRDLLSLPGEMNPYVVLAQLAAGDPAVVRAEIARDIGRPLAAGDPLDVERLAGDVTFRLAMQWPHVPIDAASVEPAVRQGLTHVDPRDGDAFTVTVLQSLTDLGVTTAAYDIGGAADDAAGEPPGPHEPTIEMLPYIGFRAWRPPTPDELARCPLVIATPRNSFRLDWLRSLLPSARIRVVHLTRNPAAAVNGLIDGWRHRGFFTTRVDANLSIAGYSDRRSHGRDWWKYDVPPRWREFTRAPLPIVAAEQWRSAHDAVLNFAARSDVPVLRVHYEDTVGSPQHRRAAGQALAEFLGIDVRVTVGLLASGVRPVMATAPPAQRRWSNSEHDLGVALAEPAVWETAATLGYEPEERRWT